MDKQLNTAQRLLESIGVAAAPDAKQAHGNKNAKATKAGTGRYHAGGVSGNRLEKPRKTRAYAALLAAWAAKRITKAKLRDKDGAYTLTGKGGVRRMWLAGISAQRGY